MTFRSRAIKLLAAATLGVAIISQVLTGTSRSNDAFLHPKKLDFQKSLRTTDDARNHTVNLAARYEPDSLADDALWERVSCKGGHLVAAMKESDEEAGIRIQDTRNPPSAASLWQGDLKEDLRKWFWHDFQEDDDVIRGDHNGYWHVEGAIRALKLNGDPGADNVPFAVYHEDKNSKTPITQQTYNVDGHEYRATGAHYKFVINYAGGVIFAQYVVSPMHGAQQNWYRAAEHNELPALNKMSDILWGYWFRGHNEVIARALHEAGRKLSVWPGTTFDASSKAGQALIGSANGASFAWFLIQHKAQLGNKWIAKVQVFWNDEDDEFEEPHLLFYVENVPSVDKASDIHKSQASINGREVMYVVEPNHEPEHTSPDKVIQVNETEVSIDLESEIELSSQDERKSKIQTQSRMSRRGYNPDDLADDGLWRKHRCKGEQLLAAMRADDKRAAEIYGLDKDSMQSAWNDEQFLANFEKWGWTSSPVHPLAVSSFKKNTMFHALDIDPRSKEDGGDNYCFKAQHGVGADARNQMYTVDDKSYRKTSALFAGAVNAKAGLLICQNVRSPQNTGFNPDRKKMTPEELPALRYMSDVFWGFWALESHDVTNLKYIMVAEVVNRDSEKLINRIIKNNGGKLNTWPGITFNHDSEEAKVLIGCPNGWAWGFLLASHKKQLGRKWISKVTIFTPEEVADAADSPIDLLFWVEDAPPEDGKTDMGSALQTIQKKADTIAVELNANSLAVKRKSKNTRIMARDYNPNLQADDQLWNQKRCKGAQHVAAMQADDKTAGSIWGLNPPTMKSKWTDSRFLDDLRKWGWICDYSGGQHSEYGYSRVFASLSLNAKPKKEGGDMECFSVGHGFEYEEDGPDDIDDEYIVDGHEYQRTFAHYEFAFNRKGGIVFIQEVKSPYTSVLTRYGATPDPEDLPTLRYLSDIVWGFWAQSSPNVKHIKGFWVQDAVNSATSKIVNRAMGRLGLQKLPPWPGHTFSASSVEGQAII
ncbi:hypothetical protein DM02DRAFT_689119, partial [Periconia macrospinosa]